MLDKLTDQKNFKFLLKNWIGHSHDPITMNIHGGKNYHMSYQIKVYRRFK